MKPFLFFFWAAACLACQQSQPANQVPSQAPASGQRISGISLEAPPKAVEGGWTQGIGKTQANWVAIVPFGYCRKNGHSIYYDTPWQWWGESPEGTRAQIRQAHQAGLKVLLKPHIWFVGSWPGDFEVGPEKADEWFNTYRKFIREFAAMAQQEGCEMFCIATETDPMAIRYPERWRRLIGEIRQVYQGPLTYAANWDQYQQIPFWGELDYIGVDAYFPLSEEKTPAVAALRRAWGPKKTALKQLSQEHNKPLLFTEFGYRSMDQCAGKQWEHEHQDRSPNTEAQKHAYEAFFREFWAEDWVAGGFLWKWYIRGNYEAEKYRDDYTPQDKPVLSTIRHHYRKTSAK